MDEWLDSTRRLQEEAFDGFPDPDTEEFADFVVWNLFAANVEIAEAAAEVGWKPWKDARGWVNREALLEEVVDVLHFLGNILVATDVSDAELHEAYHRKLTINRARQIPGCPFCGRMPPECVIKANGNRRTCGSCDAVWTVGSG